jgi:hypothetical protein
VIAGRLPAGDVELAVRTGYPWDGRVRIEVTAAPAGAWGLAVRVPDWSGETRLSLNGEPADQSAEDRGYLVVTRDWRPGDVVTLDLDLSPRLTAPSRRIDALRGTVAVQRGPLVYCFEQADQAAGVSLEDLALVGAGAGAGSDRVGLSEQAGPAGLGETVAITVPAVRLPPVAGPDDGVLPYAEPQATEPRSSATATAIPYFQWDNRDGGPMRVWLPVHPAAPGDSASDQPSSDPSDSETGRVPRPRRLS